MTNRVIWQERTNLFVPNETVLQSLIDSKDRSEEGLIRATLGDSLIYLHKSYFEPNQENYYVGAVKHTATRPARITDGTTWHKGETKWGYFWFEGEGLEAHAEEVLKYHRKYPDEERLENAISYVLGEVFLADDLKTAVSHFRIHMYEEYFGDRSEGLEKIGSEFRVRLENLTKTRRH